MISKDIKYVWLVDYGEYDDYTIVAICSNEEKAKKITNSYKHSLYKVNYEKVELDKLLIWCI